METHRKSLADDINLIRCISAEDTTFQEKLLLNHVPDWSSLVNKQIISNKLVKELTAITNKSSLDQVTSFNSNEEFTSLLLGVLSNPDLYKYRKYYVTLVYHIVKSDTSILHSMLDDLTNKPNNIFECFYAAISDTTSTSTADKVGFLLTSLITRSDFVFYSEKDIENLISDLVTGKCNMSMFGRLDSLKNLLKLDRYRPMFWNNPKAISLVLFNLDPSKQTTVYAALFCCWLLSFSPEISESFCKENILKKICTVLKESKTEKVVRVCIHCIANCLNSDSGLEVLIEQDVIHRLTLLEYEKWRDDEIYTEIRSCSITLQNKIRQLSNFGQYLKELETGRLRQSFLHSEKYWRENFMHFETNEFYAIKKLVELLQSDDPETLAVACFDLSEFARLYPAGKKIIKKLNVKEKIMLLLDHKNRNVSREALLSIQKIMLDNWKTVAEGL